VVRVVSEVSVRRREGSLNFVDWPRLPDPHTVSPAASAGLPAFVVSWEIVRMEQPHAAPGESSPFDVRLGAGAVEPRRPGRGPGDPKYRFRLLVDRLVDRPPGHPRKF